MDRMDRMNVGPDMDRFARLVKVEIHANDLSANEIETCGVPEAVFATAIACGPADGEASRPSSTAGCECVHRLPWVASASRCAGMTKWER